MCVLIDFNKLKDEALNGNKINTNRLIADTVIEEDKIHYYLSVINQRIQALNYISDSEGHQNLEKNILNLKPPVFWKDKPNFIYQAKKWNKKKIKKLLENTYKLELQIKSNSSINKTILMKKLIVDICGLANS